LASEQSSQRVLGLARSGAPPPRLRLRVWAALLGVADSEQEGERVKEVELNLPNQRVVTADAARTHGEDARFNTVQTRELISR
jgi:hypothetical protein